MNSVTHFSQVGMALRAVRSLRLHSCVAVLGLVLVGSAFAAEPAGDAQTREKLRTATLRLRDAEAELVTAKTEHDSLVEKNKALEAQLAEMRKHAEADRLAQLKKTGDLDAKLDELGKDKTLLQAELKTESERLAQSQALAQAREEARSRLVEEKLVVENVLAARQIQNVELYRTATEILARYEKFGLGEALAAKEPFVGRTRSRLETLVQDYRDALLKQRAPAKP